MDVPTALLRHLGAVAGAGLCQSAHKDFLVSVIPMRGDPPNGLEEP